MIIPPLTYILDRNPKTAHELEALKRESARVFETHLQTNRELLASYRAAVAEKFLPPHKEFEALLKTRSVRTISGVAPVTVLTKPFPCPGRCIYCPTERNMPKSYIATQPAAARALALSFDPTKQVHTRLRSYHENGHPTDKVELIVLGGTWSFYKKSYQTAFVRALYNGLNSFDGDGSVRTLHEAQTRNEKSSSRMIGLTLETRPDWISVPEIKRLRMLGATRIEMGVQSLHDDVLDLVKRDHRRPEVIHATKLLKNAGFKVVYHMMPGLPGATSETDVAMFEELFTNPDFQPDQLKIYPTVVLKNSVLYKWWERGDYKPYEPETLAKTLIGIKKTIPLYVRIERLFRDIPSQEISAGNKKTNLREYVHAWLKKEGCPCQCIRCREVKDKVFPTEYDGEFNKDEYEASGGKEYFLSYTNHDQSILFAFLRLRIPDSTFLSPLQDTALVREIHAYGKLVPISTNERTATQHQGFGKRLMAHAEEIAGHHGCASVAVIAGVGVREYFRKLGYILDPVCGYMMKKI